MDDLFYSKTQSLILYKKIVNECGEKFVHSMLLKKNYGNPKKHFRAKNFVYTAHELFHIKYIYDIKKFVSLTKNSIICEIGPGYGSMIAKIK